MTESFDPTPSVQEIAEIKRDEGCRLTAYPDPQSPRGRAMARSLKWRPKGWQSLSGAPWTIGYGHTGPEVHEGLEWTQAQADAALVADLMTHNALLHRVLPWSDNLDDVRRRVLRNMIFNMGWDNPKTPRFEGLSGFKGFLGAMARGAWAEAVRHMEDSRWALQVGHRAQRLEFMVLNGRAAQ